MSEKFKGKYRISSCRLQNWDYGSQGSYFITLCTKDRINYFGDIIPLDSIEVVPKIDLLVDPQVEARCIAPQPVDQPVGFKLQLSEIGKIAESEWLKTPDIRPDMNLRLGEFIVMPNHMHGIIIIGENQYNTSHPGMDRWIGDQELLDESDSDPVNNPVPYLQHIKNRFGSQSKNLASIMRGFKSAVTQYARIHQIEFDWQPNFYEHIIRNQNVFHRITRYIENNPRKWFSDHFFQK